MVCCALQYDVFCIVYLLGWASLQYVSCTHPGSQCGVRAYPLTDEQCQNSTEGLLIVVQPAALFRSALAPFKAGRLTQAGRALTKHPEVVGLTKQTLRQAYGTDIAINHAARDILKQIMRRGVHTTLVLPRYGAVIQCQIPGGFGARWYAAGSQAGAFIGFIGP